MKGRPADVCHWPACRLQVNTTKKVVVLAQSQARPTRERTHSVAYLMMLPASLLLFLFLIVPFGLALYFSITNQRLVAPEPGQIIGLENYRDLLRLELIQMQPETDSTTGEPARDEAGNLVYPRARTILRGSEQYAGLSELTQFEIGGTRYLLAAGDPIFLRALLNNIIFAGVVVPVQSAFALFLAILVNQKLKGMVLFRTIYFTPVVTTMAVVSVIWFFLYNPSDGFINAVLGVFGIGPYQWLNDPMSALPAIMLLSIWQGVGFQMVIFLAGLQDIPETLYEAARIDGANLWQQFRHVTLPGLRNTVIFVIISSTILAFKLFTQVEVMTFGQGGPQDSTMTMILYLVRRGFKEQSVGYAAAIAVIFVLIVLAISLAQRVLFREERA
jgi:multiple sugar transport system permease protein